MSDSRPTTGYSIAAVSKLTGISCHALRVWERRYGFPVPFRTPSGHRRYAAEQVERLRIVAARVRSGLAIGHVMANLEPQTTAAEPSVAEPEVSAEPRGAWSDLLDLLGEADLTAAEDEYDRLAAGRAPLDLLETVLEPALVETGERWFRGQFQICQEHCATAFLRRKLSGLLDAARRANPTPRHTALLGTVQGERHEGGVLMVALLLELAGWRGLVLGTDLPAREYQRAIDLWQPDVLAVSFILSRNVNKRFEELSSLRSVPVFVGGRSILNYRSLARRYGLIPLPGSGRQAVARLIAETEAPHVAVD